MIGEIETLVFEALDDVNRDLPRGMQLPIDRVSVLIGPGRRLDSLAVVTLFGAIERRIAERYGCELAIGETDQGDSDAFTTLGSLCDWLDTALARQRSGGARS